MLPDLTLGFLTIADAPPARIIRAAAAAGFSGASLRITGRHRDSPWFDILGNRQAIKEISDAVDQTGIRLSNLSGYYLDGVTTLDDLRLVLDSAQELQADHLVQGCFDGDAGRQAAMLASYVEEASQRGIRIGVEFMPASQLPDLRAAKDLIFEIGLQNVGLVIDALHLHRSGGTVAELRELDSSRIFLFQICDAPAEHPPEELLFEEAIKGRLYPGAGKLPLETIIAALPKTVEIECEIPDASSKHLSFEEQASAAFQATESFFRALST